METYSNCLVHMQKRHTKKNQKGKRKNKSNQVNAIQRIPNRVGLILPDMYVSKLRYWKQVKWDFTATNTIVARFRPSSAYDVDPLVGSTAMAGFAELATLYGSYRVISSKIAVQVVNPSAANPVNCSVTPVNIDPGAAPSSAYVLSLRENPYGKFGVVGLSGSPPLKINNQMSTQKIFGGRMTRYDDNFSALVTASPANNWWWIIGGYSFVLDPSLCWITVTIDVNVEFYDRLPLIA